MLLLPRLLCWCFPARMFWPYLTRSFSITSLTDLILSLPPPVIHFDAASVSHACSASALCIYLVASSSSFIASSLDISCFWVSALPTSPPVVSFSSLFFEEPLKIYPSFVPLRSPYFAPFSGFDSDEAFKIFPSCCVFLVSFHCGTV